LTNTPLAFRTILGKLPALKRLRAFILSRYPWAILAGLSLAAAFPNLGVAGLAWIAPALILFCAIGRSGNHAFRIGYVAGLAHYLTTLYWLLLIPVPTAWIWAKVLGWTALGAFLALYTACWVWLGWKILPLKLTGEGRGNVIQNLADQFLSIPWSRRASWTISCAALWVALEMLVARFLGGFPWNLLGDSQFHMTPLIQIASVTGVYGVSFLAVWFALSLGSATIVIIRRPAMRSIWMGEIILPMLAVAAVFGTGYNKLRQPDPAGPTLKIALVQPSIPQSTIWDEAENDRRFQDVLRLSEQALTNKPDLLIWPESAVPKMIRDDDDTLKTVAALARAHKVWMIIGDDDYTPHPGAKTWADCDFYNSSFLINRDGDVVAEYKKQNLVIFGEYVPLVKWLPFLKHLTPISGGFTPGDRPVPFELGDLKVKVSVLICFEDVFPQLARHYVDDDTDFLVNITNDGWFGEGAAQWQQGGAAIFRAIENGLPLVRCSNTGLTCWADSCGRLRQIFQSEQRGIYGPGFMTVRIPVLSPGEKRVATFYRRHGDWFGWGCVGLALFRILGARFKRPAPGTPDGRQSGAGPV
jgi:apolipoprotein N-acyltransferase